MELFLISILGAVVLWLVLRERRRSGREQKMTELFERMSRVEKQISSLQSSLIARAKSDRETDGPDSIVSPLAPEQEPDAASPNSANRDRYRDTQTDRYVPFRSEDIPKPEVLSPPTQATAPEIAGNFERYSSEIPVAQRSTSLEEKLGGNWLNKLGIVILVIGVAFFLAYQLRTLGAPGKVIVGYAVSGTLLFGGLLMERRNKYQMFARTGIGGGWALTFFVTYAIYHVPATQVLSSQATDLVLMMLVAVGMVWHSLVYKSQVVTGLAFLLAFCTVSISHVTVFSLAAGVILAVGLVFVASREHWYELELAGLAGVYLNHYLWLSRVLEARGGGANPFPEFFVSTGFIFFYWSLFRVVYIWRVPRSAREEQISSVTAILNSLALLGLLKYQSAHPEWAFRGLIALGTIEMLLALFSRQRRRFAFVILSSIASILLLAAIPLRYSGTNWSLLWLLEAEVLFLSGLRLKEVIFRRLGLIAGIVVAFQLATANYLPILLLRQLQPDAGRHPTAAFVLASGAIVYWLNSQIATRRWKGIIDSKADTWLLRATSYLGLLAGAAGLWVFFPDSQTVVAWMVLVVGLGLAADGLESGDLAAQADILAMAVFIRIVAINSFATGEWGAVSERAVTVGVAIALYYLASRRRTKANALKAHYVAPAYSWAGSILLGLLAWYELPPTNVALGWGLAGLVLFEVGYRRRPYLRHQGYALLAASFMRILLVNFNASAASPLFSHRMVAVLPLIAAYYWVYERLHADAETTGRERHVANIAAFMVTIAVIALIYVEVAARWVAVAWAATVLVLMLVAWLLNRRLFLSQALLLCAGVFARAVLFNLYSSPSASSSFWNGRVFCVGSAVALILLSLPIAFHLRSLGTKSSRPENLAGWMKLMLARPEQMLFFAPLLLSTILLAVEMRAGMITVAWSALGVAVFLFALLVRERSYRLAGLALLLLGVCKILVIDIWRLGATDRYITLIFMGVALLLVSFLYTRYREVILRFL